MGKYYAVSDLHGQLWAYEEIIKRLEPDDLVYCLGDCVDRGPYGWKIMEEVFYHPQFIYLKGNHEQLLEEAIKEYLETSLRGHNCFLLKNNGGADTLDAMANKTKEELELWLKRLKHLKTEAAYVNKSGQLIWLNHSGHDKLNPAEDDLLWSRDHFKSPWQYEDDAFMVHGHTPIVAMKLRMGLPGIYNPADGAYKYCDGHKINIDVNACNTGWCVLLDLDTLESETINFLC